MSRSRRILLVLAGIVGTFLLYQGITTIVAYTDVAYVRSDLVAVAPQVSGRIVAVHVTDNQTVTHGDRLISIDPVPFQLVLAERQAEIDRAEAQLAVDQDDLAAARDAAGAANADADFARETQRRIADLARTADSTPAQLEAANDTLNKAVATASGREAEIAPVEALATVHQAGLAAPRWHWRRRSGNWNEPYSSRRLTAPDHIPGASALR